MSHEALQYDMFSGALVDNRSDAQKKRDRERAQPQQLEMFAAREVVQFGVNPRPLISLSEHTRLTLWHEDPRTEEERAADRQQAIDEATYPLFGQRPEFTADAPEIAEASEAQIVFEVSALIGAQPPASPSETAVEVESQPAPDEGQEREAFRLRAQFFNVLAQAAYPNGANHRENLTVDALAALNREMVAHIQQEVSREGFWEVDWAQETLQDWIWHFLEMHCITEGDLARCQAAASEIMQVAHRVWQAEWTANQTGRVEEPAAASMVADTTTMALVIDGFWDWPQTWMDNTPRPEAIV